MTAPPTGTWQVTWDGDTGIKPLATDGWNLSPDPAAGGMVGTTWSLPDSEQMLATQEIGHHTLFTRLKAPVGSTNQVFVYTTDYVANVGLTAIQADGVYSYAGGVFTQEWVGDLSSAFHEITVAMTAAAMIVVKVDGTVVSTAPAILVGIPYNYGGLVNPAGGGAWEYTCIAVSDAIGVGPPPIPTPVSRVRLGSALADTHPAVVLSLQGSPGSDAQASPPTARTELPDAQMLWLNADKVWVSYKNRPFDNYSDFVIYGQMSHWGDGTFSQFAERQISQIRTGAIATYAAEEDWVEAWSMAFLTPTRWIFRGYGYERAVGDPTGGASYKTWFHTGTLNLTTGVITQLSYHRDDSGGSNFICPLTDDIFVMNPLNDQTAGIPQAEYIIGTWNAGVPTFGPTYSYFSTVVGGYSAGDPLQDLIRIDDNRFCIPSLLGPSPGSNGTMRGLLIGTRTGNVIDYTIRPLDEGSDLYNTQLFRVIPCDPQPVSNRPTTQSEFWWYTRDYGNLRTRLARIRINADNTVTTLATLTITTFEVKIYSYQDSLVLRQSATELILSGTIANPETSDSGRLCLFTYDSVAGTIVADLLDPNLREGTTRPMKQDPAVDGSVIEANLLLANGQATPVVPDAANPGLLLTMPSVVRAIFPAPNAHSEYHVFVSVQLPDSADVKAHLGGLGLVVNFDDLSHTTVQLTAAQVVARFAAAQG